MNLSDELQKLRELHASGALTAAEFEAAKTKLLGGSGGPPPMPAAASPDVLAAYQTPVTAGGPPAPVDKEAATRQWAMWLHLSQLANFLIPPAGWIAPIVIWQVKKNELPGIDVHGCNATNWVISALIYTVISIILLLILVGIPMLIVLWVLGAVFPIIAAVKANNGEVWNYPITINFFKPKA